MFRKPNPQNWLNHKFPTLKEKEKVKILFISSWNGDIHCLSSSSLSEAERKDFRTFSFTEENLTGDLDLSGLVNLEKVWIRNQALDRIEISGCQKLKSYEFKNRGGEGVSIPKVINIPPAEIPMGDFRPRHRQIEPNQKSFTPTKIRNYLSSKILPPELTLWEDFYKLFPTEEEDNSILIARILKLEGEAFKKAYEYFKVFFKFVNEEQSNFVSFFSSDELEFLKESVGKIVELKKNFEEVIGKGNQLQTQLKQRYDELAAVRKNLDASKSELTKKEQEFQSCQEKLTNLEENKESETKNLQTQLEQKEKELTKLRDETTNSTASLRKDIDSLKKQLAELESKKEKENKELTQQLASLLVSSELLGKQVENLTAERDREKGEKERIRLESEIKANLVREQSDKLREREEKIRSYETLLRKAEENLSQCQKIVQSKSELLERLEKEKNLIGEELDLVSSRIKELEQGEILYQQKILQLESKIRELESRGDGEELEKLRKELVEEKKKSQNERNKANLEINRLKNELVNTKLREEELAEKIKELNKKPIRIQETQEQKSFWTLIKKPLFYTGGIILVIITLGWIYSKFKE